MWIQNQLMDKFKEIHDYCRRLHLTDYNITEKGLINVVGDVHISELFEGLPSQGKIQCKFGIIKGNFVISDDRISSLENSPYEVSGDFDCSWCAITSLEHAPVFVGGMFGCDNNQLTSLDHFPKYVGGSIYIHMNVFEENENFYRVLKSLLSIQYPEYCGEYESVKELAIDEESFDKWYLVTNRLEVISNIIKD